MSSTSSSVNQNPELSAVVSPHLKFVNNLPTQTILPLSSASKLTPTAAFTPLAAHHHIQTSAQLNESYHKSCQEWYTKFLEYIQLDIVYSDHNLRSTSSTVALPSTLERAKLQVQRRMHVTTSSAQSASHHFRRWPFCDKLCTATNAFMWETCSHCHFPVHFECDDDLFHFNSYLCNTYRSTSMD